MDLLKKLKMSLFETNIALTAFCAYLAKILVFKDASIEDALVMTVLTGLYGYGVYLRSKQPLPINTQVITELEKLKSTVDGLKMEKSIARKPAKYF